MTRVELLFSIDSTSMRARAAREMLDKLWHNLSNSTKFVDTRRVDLALFEVSDSFFPPGESYLCSLNEKKRKEEKNETW